MDRRQTQENTKEKAVPRPSNRISRLAQPRNYSATPHSLRRNRSSSHENVSQYNRQVQKRSRSTSVAPRIPSETPVRPPFARSLSLLFTPASTNRSVASTSRSSTLRRSDDEQTARILDVLRNHFGPTFLSGGLQSMSAKQFVEIIRFFAQSITGNKVAIHDNNVDDVKLFADYIEYPHQMNKSWFKAPTVSIAYERNVEFLDWLCSFIVIDDDSTSINDYIEYKDTESDSLINQQFVASFVGDLKIGFAIWSDRTEEFDGWKLKWIREMIHTKTGLDDIDDSIGRIQSEYTMMQTEEMTFGNEHLLQTQQKKVEELKKQLAKLQDICHEKVVDAQMYSEELNSLTSTNEQLEKTVKEMKETIKNQPVSAEDRQSRIADLTQKKHLLSEKNIFVNSLKAVADDSQVKIARLKQQKTSKIYAINTVVQKLFQIGINFGDLTIDQLSISENDTQSKIKAKLELFAQVKEIINNRRTDIHKSVNDTQSQLKSISNELFVVENEVSSLKKHLQTNEVRLRKVEDEIVETQYKAEQQQHKLQATLDRTTDTIQKIKIKIENKEKNIESLKAENKAIFEGIQMKTDAMLNAKRERQARLAAAVAELEQETEELKNIVYKLN
ncbi:myosin heavy chain, non-muscle-like [Bradysia coprophila]|uniref:myosin heavy chain, non-muscle-like n=1 Tax=Bradysia coprophila TaxID=38358 RepID=UPI00187D9E4A|nr:myosin heavy chain, non-muscle-like [Bradysia coprophila]